MSSDPKMPSPEPLKARKFFANMPDEVFDMWIAPLVEKDGWPYSDDGSGGEDSPWRYHLGRIPMGIWRSAYWELAEIDWASFPISPLTAYMIDAIKESGVSGAKTVATHVVKSQERFRTFTEMFLTSRKLNKPIVAFVRNGKIEVIDGLHRMAALLYVGIPTGYRVPVWMPRKPLA